MKQGFEYFRYGVGFRIFTSLFEILSVIIIIIGIWIQLLTTIGGANYDCYDMIEVILIHIIIKNQIKRMLMPIILLLLGLGITFINWTALF